MKNNTPTTKKYTFHVNGMHCNACVLMTESEIGDMANVTHVKTSLSKESIEVVGDFGQMNEEEVTALLTEAVAPHGYTVTTAQRVAAHAKWSDFKIAAPVALVFLVLFLLLQKAGLVNLIGGTGVTYSTAFIVGIVASLSTCMAVVGGVVLSMSATFAKGGSVMKPQLMFHVGRIVSFFVLGGVIGSIGSAFTLSDTGTFVLSFIIGLVMLILGINLLDVFPWAKKFQPSMPKFLSRYALSVSKANQTITPLLIGVATFFLPCGFTQSMQLYTLSTGSFLAGGLTMLSFALGTLPVLALVSFSSLGIMKSTKSGVFFKTAGLIVIMFALFNLLTSLVAVGLIAPFFNF